MKDQMKYILAAGLIVIAFALGVLGALSKADPRSASVSEARFIVSDETYLGYSAGSPNYLYSVVDKKTGKEYVALIGRGVSLCPSVSLKGD